MRNLQPGNRTRIDFVKAELDAALTFCRLAQQSSENRLPRYVRSARRSYDAALKFLFTLDMADKEFDRITAVAERLRFTLEALESRCNGRHSE